MDTALICQLCDAWADCVILESCLHLSESDISYDYSMQLLVGRFKVFDFAAQHQFKQPN